MMVFENINRFNSVKTTYNSHFDGHCVNMEPVAILGDLWVINEEVLTDVRYNGFFTDLFTDFDYELRAVAPNEYIVNNNNLP